MKEFIKAFSKFTSGHWYVPVAFLGITTGLLVKWAITGEYQEGFDIFLLSTVVLFRYSQYISNLSRRVDMLDDENDYLHKKVNALNKIDSKEVARVLLDHWKDRPL